MDKRYRLFAALWDTNQSTTLLKHRHAPYSLGFFMYLSDIYGRSPVSRQLMIEELRELFRSIRDDQPDIEMVMDPIAVLASFSSEDKGWLNAFYPKNRDEIHYTLSSGLENALAFAREISSRPFYGTESRLQLYLGGIDDLYTAMEVDPQQLIEVYKQQRRELMDRIHEVEREGVRAADPRKIREQYLTLVSLSRHLESDVYGVVGAFEELNRKTRMEINHALADRSEALEKILSQHNVIQNSDQGKSFMAFFRLLMNSERLDDIRMKIDSIHSHPAIASLDNNELDGFENRLRVASLQAQRRFQDIAVSLGQYLEEHRGQDVKHFYQMLNEISSIGMRLKSCPPQNLTMQLPEKRIPVNLNFGRPLYEVKVPVDFIPVALRTDISVDISQVIDTNYLQVELIREQIDKLLLEHTQVSLSSVVARHPIHEGLSELLAFYGLAKEYSAVISKNSKVPITWTDADGSSRVALCPQIIFTRDDQNVEE
jgi:hypothetical protein